MNPVRSGRKQRQIVCSGCRRGAWLEPRAGGATWGGERRGVHGLMGRPIEKNDKGGMVLRLKV